MMVVAEAEAAGMLSSAGSTANVERMRDVTVLTGFAATHGIALRTSLTSSFQTSGQNRESFGEDFFVQRRVAGISYRSDSDACGQSQ